MTPHLYVRQPPKSLADGIVSHIEDLRESIDYNKALDQWRTYTSEYKERGWNVTEVEDDDSLPDSVFIEDAAVYVSGNSSQAGCFVITSPANAARENEVFAVEATLSSSHITVERIERPGTLDGGDILKEHHSRTVYVGDSERTNEEGFRQFSAIVTKRGWKVERVPVVKALHLKSMLTALPDGTIIGYEPLIEDAKIFPSFLAVPEPEGAAVVFLEPNPAKAKTLLISSSAPLTAALLKKRGYDIVQVDVSEFEKLEGCVTCLSIRMRD